MPVQFPKGLVLAILHMFAAVVACDVVIETMVLVSGRLEDKNESLGLGLEHLVLVSVSVLKKKSCSFSRLLL